MISSDLVKGVIQGSTGGCSVPHFPSWNGQPQVAVKHCETMELQHDTGVWKNDGKLVLRGVHDIFTAGCKCQKARQRCVLTSSALLLRRNEPPSSLSYLLMGQFFCRAMTPEPLSCLVWSTPPNGGRWGVPPWFFLAAWRFNHGLLYLAVFDDGSWFSKRVLITWPWVCLKMEYEIGYPKFSWWIVIVP